MILTDGKMKMEIHVTFISGDCSSCDANSSYMRDTVEYIVTLHRGELFLMEEDAEVSRNEWIEALYGLRNVASGKTVAFVHEFEDSGLTVSATRVGDDVQVNFKQDEWMGLGSSYIYISQRFSADEAVKFVDDELNSYEDVLCTKIEKCDEERETCF